jgi:murein DD-endopeptidase MepM/ murein hydrolase activator NlpD
MSTAKTQTHRRGLNMQNNYKQGCVEHSVKVIIPGIFIQGLILILLIAGLSTKAQQSNPIESYKLVFYDGNEMHTSDMNGNSVSYGVDIKIQKSALIEANESAFHVSQVNEDLKISDGMILFWGIKSPFSSNWLYLERDLYSNRYTLSLLDHMTGDKKVVFDEKQNPFNDFVLKPFAWSSEENIIYLEALKFDAGEHQGIYSFNLQTLVLNKLNVFENYMNTPVISPDRKFLFYSGTSDIVRDEVEGKSDILFLYDLQTDQEKKLVVSKSGMFIPIGWTSSNIPNERFLPANASDKSDNSGQRIMQLSFKLPWKSGLGYCVSRTGTPAPTGIVGSSISCSYQPGAHGYVATDFDTPNGVYDPITAVASGIVTYIGWDPTGYGNYIVITHNDNTQTLYAHLNQVLVVLNQTVSQGCTIGDGGTTGGSTGDHLHFEWRIGGTKQYATFDECNCQAHPYYYYSSQNYLVSCASICMAPSGLYSSNISSSNATIFWSATSGANYYQLQWKTSVSGTWNTYNVSGTSFTLSGLAPGTGYNYRMRTYCTSGNYSNYTGTYSFTTTSSSGCQQPFGLYVSSISSTSVTINWNSPSANSYNYFLKPASQVSYWSYYNYTYRPITFSGLQPGTTYNFKLSNNCSSGTSSASNVLTFTTSSFRMYGNDNEIETNTPTLSGDDLILSPNPVQAGGLLMIESVRLPKEASLYSIDGKIISRKIIDTNSFEIPSTISAGIYFLRAEFEDGNTSTGKVIVQ